MTDTKTPAELEQQLWHEIDKVRTGMLGLVGGPPQHMQPMTAFTDEAEGSIWFYARKDSDLVAQTGAGHKAMMCLLNKDHSFIACVSGDLSEQPDPDKIQRFWNPIVAAWFPEGKDDAHLTLLRMIPDDAQVWVSHANPIRFGFEIAKANLTHTTPDVGQSEHLKL